MKNYKTTLAGIVATVGVALANDPHYHALGTLLLGLGTFLTGSLAKDHDSQDAPVLKQASLPLGRVAAILFFVWGLALTPGCAYSSGHTSVPVGTNGATMDARMRAWTFFDSHNELAKGSALNGTNRSGVSFAGLEQTASGSNAVATLNALQGIIQSLPK